MLAGESGDMQSNDRRTLTHGRAPARPGALTMRLAGIAVVLGALGAVIGQGPAVGSAMAAGKQISVPKVVETRRFVVTFKIPVDSTPESDRIRTAQNRLIADLSRFPVKVIRRPASVPRGSREAPERGQRRARRDRGAGTRFVDRASQSKREIGGLGAVGWHGRVPRTRLHRSAAKSLQDAGDKGCREDRCLRSPQRWVR